MNSDEHIPTYLINDIWSQINQNTKKICTSTKLAFYLQDSPDYIHSDVRPILITTEPYKLGSIKKIDIYIDPLMKWDDDRILFFDVNNKKINVITINMNYHYTKRCSGFGV
jgi:hypothetical protein